MAHESVKWWKTFFSLNLFFDLRIVISRLASSSAEKLLILSLLWQFFFFNQKKNFWINLITAVECVCMALVTRIEKYVKVSNAVWIIIKSFYFIHIYTEVWFASLFTNRFLSSSSPIAAYLAKKKHIADKMLGWWSPLALRRPRVRQYINVMKKKRQKKLSQIEIYNRNTESLLVQLWRARCDVASEREGGEKWKENFYMMQFSLSWDLNFLSRAN